MHYDIRYKPAFAAIFITLSPGESITAEAGAMTSMDGRLTMKTRFSGGFLPGLLKKFFGGESLFVNTFMNQTQQPLTLVLTQSTIGDIACEELRGRELCFEPGAYIAHAGQTHLGVKWAGFKSWFAREGLFKLQVKGTGLVFFGAYGGITKHRVNGEFVVDTGHLVAYEPTIKMNLGLAGGLVGSITSGEGVINRLTGNGYIYLQSRSVDGLVKYLTPKFR
ncbi:TIGR00266 family protein [Desertifilum sp. FACHB-1129]|uniref:TIGR00266 family protein n=1 Tax=Desertifilum tharense IPPAS B-1220 TaxID=1781255 RepID=A0A1E5QM42_9CYAN|nr:TIGR00266 family protein [Desertifilum tharense]MBD2313667.1 TIGR00266 family protein [Desertifilum sp. FACHB-1129]MBD2324819.1 TIGR00266 family protein [Desertifilum sp. FACHB-866]MBD2334933.1 TIGR00266 family protein [Desertifilum sp. FACHB-868]MDA0213395.1 TIGR00266 family protein [Cyanobacteria bacterium FC1]OEJ75698.1 TIGR00266 family protein [Desertifilum tharense IPPAS B-1220]